MTVLGRKYGGPGRRSGKIRIRRSLWCPRLIKMPAWINQGLTVTLEQVSTWCDVHSEQARFGIVLGGREQSDMTLDSEVFLSPAIGK